MPRSTGEQTARHLSAALATLGLALGALPAGQTLAQGAAPSAFAPDAPLAGHGNPSQRPPQFGAEIELVRLDVTVADRDGRPVTGLSAADFEVIERGRPHEIVGVEQIDVSLALATAPTAPPSVSTPRPAEPSQSRCFVLFIDTMVDDPLRREFQTFFERDLRDGDWVVVVSPALGISWTARTPWEHRLLPGLVGRILTPTVLDPFGDASAGGSAEWEAMQAVESGPRGGSILAAEEVYQSASLRATRTLSALRDAIESIEGFRGRKSVILISPGFLRSPRTRSLQQEVITTARRAGVRIHFVSARGLTVERSWLQTGAAGAVDLTFETGGRTFETNELAGPVAEALAESSSYYLLGIRPLAGAGEHRVKVRVKRRGLTVSARERYFVEKQAQPAAASSRLALRSAFDETGLPLRVTTAPRGAAEPGKTAVALGISVADECTANKLHVELSGRRLEGKESIEGASDIVLEPPARSASVLLRLEPGTWQIRVVALDAASGALGSVLHTFEVPAGAAQP